jgi:hypothetical protein
MIDNLPNSIFDVFLSHAHVDSALVVKLAAKLADEAHFNIWLDKWRLIPGEHWQQEMAKGLDEARTCVVCVGKHTSTGWFREEIERALNRQTKDRSFRVIPLILPYADLGVVDNFLELRTWIDFSTGLENQDAFHLLVSGIRGVAPGRGPAGPEIQEKDIGAMREHLSRIRSLRREQLIDDAIALEYQRRLLDRLIQF